MVTKDLVLSSSKTISPQTHRDHSVTHFDRGYLRQSKRMLGHEDTTTEIHTHLDRDYFISDSRISSED